MEFRILGPLEVLDDGRPVALGGLKQRQLLTLLLLSAGRVVSRDRLIDGLWGETPPETAATALQVYVSHLRKIVGPKVILTRSPGYMIRLEEGQLDLARFEHLVAEARADEPGAAAEKLREALGLWRGPPLADLDGLEIAPGEQAHLEESRLAAVEERIDADLRLGRHADLVPELDGLVREHPLRERLRGQLMLALYRCGRQADALDAYREGRKLLDEELGLQPGEELRRLERGILEQDPALALFPADRGRAAVVPTGTVTFLFTDVENAAKLADDLGDDYLELLERHHALLRGVLEEHGGMEIDSRDAALFFVFRRARDCVRAAVEAQKAVAAAEWPQNAAVRIRIGLHTGEPGFAESGYQGLDVVRAARISASAHGGQILISSATRDLVDTAVADVSFEDLGEHKLEEIEQPQRVFQVVAPGLEEDLPPPRTVDASAVTPISGREQELAAAAGIAIGVEERRVRLLRRSQIVTALGALLVAGAIAGIAVALTGGSAAVRVVPDSVAVIDARSGRLEADIRVGKRPVAVAAGEGGVWVADAGDRTVWRIDPKSRKVVSRIGLGTDVTDIAVGYGSVWVADGSDETITRIDPKLDAVRDTISLGARNALEPNPVLSVTTGGGSIWATRGSSLVRIDPQTGERATFPIHRPVAIAAGGDAVWVATEEERLLRVDARELRRTGALSLPGLPVAMVYRAGAVWLIVVVGLHTGQIWRVDAGTVQPTWAATSTGMFDDIAIGGDAVWLVATRDGTVRRIDTRSQAHRTVTLGLAPVAIAADVNSAWVAVQRR